jgi:hypothetical protein
MSRWQFVCLFLVLALASCRTGERPGTSTPRGGTTSGAVASVARTALRSPRAVYCLGPNGPQDGNVPFSAVTPRCDAPPPCGGYGAAFGVTVETTAPTRIVVTLKQLIFDEREHLIGNGPDVVAEVPARGRSSVVACSSSLDLRDINNPRAYAYQYQLIKAAVVSDTTPVTASCPQAAPSMSSCGALPVPPGTFEPVSAAILFAKKENGVWVVPPNQPACIDRHAPTYDRFQQAQCREHAANLFRIENPDLQGCYMMLDANERLIRPRSDGSVSDLEAASVQEVFTFNCQARIDKVHWQLVPVPGTDYYLIKNKATGGCIEAQANDQHQNVVEGPVNVQVCASWMPQQRWRLKRITWSR